MADQKSKEHERAAFEAWWEREGQFCRAGGGDYEKTFAFSAWNARATQASAPADPAVLIERMRTLESDHGPDGWPAVRMRDISALCDLAAHLRAPADAQQRCPHCDDTGDVNSITGEWRGVCSCAAGDCFRAPAVVSQQLTTEAAAPQDAVNAMCFKIAAIAEECADPGTKASLLGLLCEPPPTTADTWPIAKLVVKDGAITASFYTPGLPDGAHDVWPCPVSVDAEAVAERAAELHDNAAMPLAEALELALSEAGAAGAVPAGWRPVEEAPKNLIIVLAEAGRSFRGYWHEMPFREYRDIDGFYTGQQDAEAYWARAVDGGECNPTHWQHDVLPPAPQQQGGGK